MHNALNKVYVIMLLQYAVFFINHYGMIKRNHFHRSQCFLILFFGLFFNVNLTFFISHQVNIFSDTKNVIFNRVEKNMNQPNWGGGMV